MDKNPDAFKTISEVAQDMELPQHVLRFWETRFSQIKPMKRRGGRRYYRPTDVDLIRGIRHLLYDEGYTIKGVQRILKDEGASFVQNIWREAVNQPIPLGGTPPPLVSKPEPATATLALERTTNQSAVDDSPELPIQHTILPQTSPRQSKKIDEKVSEQLQLTLFELLECKRILDRTREDP